MNPDTGAIAEFETAEDAEDAGYTVPLDDELARKMRQLNRAERRKMIADGSFPKPARARQIHALAKLAGMTDDDVRKLRNAEKRARSERR